ncbi:MAG: class I SAM-dependent methyltransferase [Oscillospiraceae bacterium]|nr:class I SAM-dependent methyltransferase [Oscillospiraceae bacterium]
MNINSYGMFSRFYDTLTDSDYYKKLYNLYCELLRESGTESGTVLDLACGTGKLTIKLADEGYDCIGADASPEMLSIAINKSADKNITYICQHMQDLDLYGSVNAVVCALDSLNHITNPEELAIIFERVSLFLEPGGVFIFDVNTVYKHWLTLSDNSFVYECEDFLLVWLNQTEGDLTDITLDFFVKQDNRAETNKTEQLYRRYTEHLCERGYDYETIDELAKKAGLKITSAKDFENNGKITGETQRAIYTAVKSSSLN